MVQRPQLLQAHIPTQGYIAPEGGPRVPHHCCELVDDVLQARQHSTLQFLLALAPGPDAPPTCSCS